MADVYHQTIKGIYQYPQMNDFISVRNYIFTWHKEKRCLLLRFINNFDQEINELEFTITQLDVHGKVIKSVPVKHKKLTIMPGALYTPGRAILVEDGCADFKISFDKVRSGEYTYRVVEQQLVAYYPHPEKKFLDDENIPNGAIYGFHESRKTIGVPNLAYLIAALTLGLVLLLNLGYVIAPLIDLSGIIENIFESIGDAIDDIFDFILEAVETIFSMITNL